MNNKIIFLRHAKTKKDNSIPVSEWILTEEGNQDAEKVANIKEFETLDILFSSTEPKASLTIKPLAKKLNKEIIQIENLSEINRDKGGFMKKEEYDIVKKKIFEDLDFTTNNWETCNNALKRFRKAVEEINQKYENKKILICAHGTVMTLYFSFLQNSLDNLMPRWKALGFCDWGIIENGEVIKDIIK